MPTNYPTFEEFIQDDAAPRPTQPFHDARVEKALKAAGLNPPQHRFHEYATASGLPRRKDGNKLGRKKRIRLLALDYLQTWPNRYGGLLNQLATIN